ncbi:MAG: hypothetical protein HOQ05_12810 [Corynebacteriales bacterium]|nr:hypothetical protein [Mycobacteriales bacterium]
MNRVSFLAAYLIVETRKPHNHGSSPQEEETSSLADALGNAIIVFIGLIVLAIFGLGVVTALFLVGDIFGWVDLDES